MKKKLLLEIIACCCFILLSWWSFKPLLRNLNNLTSFLPDDYDSLFISWSIKRMADNFPAWPNQLFQGNIFHPHPYSHAYSDPFLFAGLLAKPFNKLSAEPVLAFNINLILAQFLSLAFSYLFLKQLTKDRLIAFVSAVVFALSPIHSHYLSHLHTFAIQLLPLSGYLLLKLKTTGKTVWFYCWLASFILQLLNSFLPGYFIIFLSLVLLINDQQLTTVIKEKRNHFLIAFVLGFLILFPFINIYLKVSRHFNYVRPLTDVIHFSLSPEEIITKFFSPALYLSFLIALTGFFSFLKKRQKLSWKFFILTIFSLIISLGPVLHWQRKTIKIPFHLPLPYLLFYFLAPGFKGFRTPSRWIILAAFSAVCFTSLGFKNIFKKSNKLKSAILLSILAISLITNKPFKKYSRVPTTKNYPAVYHWLKDQDCQVIIELPISAWGTGKQAKEEAQRMLYSLSHQKSLVNGFSGYTPAEYYQLVQMIRKDFLNQTTISQLKKTGVDYLIIHQKEYPQEKQEAIKEKLTQLKKNNKIKLIKQFDSDEVYQL